MKFINKKNSGEVVIIELQPLHAYDGLYATVQTKAGNITPEITEKNGRLIVIIPSSINHHSYKGVLKVLDSSNKLLFYMDLNVYPVAADRIIESKHIMEDERPSDQETSVEFKDKTITEPLFFDRKDIAYRAKKIVFK